MYADIIIDITHEKLDKVFQYSIPSRLEGMLEVGTEVVVPFGRGNKETHGYVIAFSEKNLNGCNLKRVQEKQSGMKKYAGW